jgi:hypothetical protein
MNVAHWLQQFDPRDLVLAAFFAGMWFSDRRSRNSLRDQGRRIGSLERAATALENELWSARDTAAGRAHPHAPRGSDAG